VINVVTDRYSISICKGSALLEETKALLRAWNGTESTKELSERILREGVLGRMTAYRARDIVNRVFAKRFLCPNPQPAFLLKRLLERNQSGQLFSDICLLYAARADALIRDAVTQMRDNYATSRRTPSTCRRFLAESEMHPVVVIIADVI